ncbi:MAG: sugar ABC transporter substrate-binding protein [Chloroflexi bacterium]|nr:MAG: sugar ABC transporter substrate-binding protein [Chloroflexota bacterium]
MMRKLNSLVVLLVVASMMLTACGRSTPAPTEEPAAPEPTATEAPKATEKPPEPTATKEPEEPAAEEKVTIRWFVGLGAGSEPENIPGQDALVEEFNNSQDEIELVVEYVDYEQAPDVLSTQIAGGNPPDIIGPVGWSGVNPFEGLFLDMEPYLEEMNFDWSDFADASVEAYRLEEGLVGIPFAVYPSFIYYNRDLFDEAGLDYPPHEWGADYADGDPWDIAKLEELAMLLTVDANGNDATSPDFDPENIVQFGYHTVWSDGLRTDCAALFGADKVVDEDGNAYLSDDWRECVRWYYSGIHEKHFIPNQTYETSDLLGNDNTFNSGNLAMTHSHLWYTCCVEEVPNWDAAAVPSYNGELTSKLHADTFRILASTEHPKEAVEVVVWMTGEAAPDLLQIYGGMPARQSQQDAFFESLNDQFPQGVDWQVVIDGLNYPDVPNHESNMPNYSKAFDRLWAFHTLMTSEAGLDIEAEMDKLVDELQAIFDEAE